MTNVSTISNDLIYSLLFQKINKKSLSFSIVCSLIFTVLLIFKKNSNEKVKKKRWKRFVKVTSWQKSIKNNKSQQREVVEGMGEGVNAITHGTPVNERGNTRCKEDESSRPIFNFARKSLRELAHPRRTSHVYAEEEKWP